MRRLSLGLLGVLLLTSSAHAADNACKLQQLGALPVTMSGTKPMISGTINGQPAVFLADSGMFYSVMPGHAAEKFNLRQAAPPANLSYIRGIGGNTSFRVATVKDFSLTGLMGGAVLHNIEFAVASQLPLMGADGIIGQNILGTGDVEFDFANGFIRLFRSLECSDKSLAYWAGTAPVGVVEIERRDVRSPHIVGNGTINGVKIRIMFDTGASRSLLSQKAAARAGITPEQDDVRAAGGMVGVGKNTVAVSLARFDELDIGGEKIKNARLMIGDVALVEADMLLGSDFFLSHRVYFSGKQRKLYFTYNGGRVFDLGAKPTIADMIAPPPVTAPALATAVAATEVAASEVAASSVVASSDGLDAEGLRRRGAASTGRQDFVSAIADFDQAIKLEPSNAENYYLRGHARLLAREFPLAVADLEQALKLKPDHVAALVERGTVRLARDNVAGAREDFDAAIKAQPNDPSLELRIAQAYTSSRHFSIAIERYDQWIAAYPKEPHLPVALNGRCWSRAISNVQMDMALADCNAALKQTNTAQFYDSRGVVWLRRGEFDKAIADFNASLKLQPRSPMTLYGLGVAETKKGLKKEGENNMQAAVAITPAIAEFFKRNNLGP
jgi:tetratricopeptide (TPR) repeat protein